MIDSADPAAPTPPAPAPSTTPEPPAPGRKRTRRGRASASDKPTADRSDAAKPTGAARTPRAVHPVLESLAQHYPHLFGEVFRPLKRGIFQDLLAAHPDLLERDSLKEALAQHTRSTRYLVSVAAGMSRHDLAGEAVEGMAPE